VAQVLQPTTTAQVEDLVENALGLRLRHSWLTWRKKPLGLIGGFIVVAMIVVAVLAPQIAPYAPSDFAGGRLESPSGSFLLGTDSLGRDVFSRTIYGAQISIAVGVSAATIAIVAGGFFGILGGYLGGAIDTVIQRALEVLASFPGIVLALILISILGQASATSSGNLLETMWKLRSLEVAIAASMIFGNMRVIRAAVLRERNLTYVEAARSIGAPTGRILWRHILPNVMPYLIVAFSTVIGSVILIEAALSFLGYGVAAGTPSWGGDLSARNREFFTIAPWLMIGPGVALSLTVLGYNFLGDALRDILDPRLRGSR
jgi:peptide/nickel transport system permease protein